MIQQQDLSILKPNSRQDQITANDVARVLNLSVRQSRDLLSDWVKAGWLEMISASRKSRAYRLSAEYRQFIGDLSAG